MQNLLNTIPKELIITFSVIFFLNLITSTLSQLKYVLANKSKSWEIYALIAVDTLFYLWSLKLVMKDTSIWGMIILTLGKLLGITLANFVEDKLIKKIYLYQIYLSDYDFVLDLEREAHKNNISITTVKGYSNGIERFVISAHLTAKQAKWLFTYMKDNGIKDPTADAFELSKTFGNIKDRLEF